MALDKAAMKGLVVDGAPLTDPAIVLTSLKEVAPSAVGAALDRPLVQEMIAAMQASSVELQFGDITGLLDNILFRLAAIAAMADLNIGANDCDYFNPDIGLKTRIGTTGPSRVSAFWAFMNPQDDWDAEWQQVDGTVPSAVMQPAEGAIFPFRGECAGAVQLCVYWGLLNGLGAARFDTMAAKFGTMYVGPWRIGKTPNPATLYMQAASLQDPPIPGDYLYFHNKDDYATLAPNGFWMGLNCMYMGKDMLGTGHYSGMGASWQTEANLRMALSNAYYHDCCPHTISDPMTEVRFTQRNILTIPGTLDMTKSHGSPTKSTGQGTVPPTKTLLAQGYVQRDAARYAHETTTLGDVSALFGIAPDAFRQHRSSGMDRPFYRADVDHGTILVTFADGHADRADPGALVSAHVTLRSPN
ncbi:hypothetical protein [Yoonia vestfoldensis]|uniref:hypothetical protein n=1 Tax=Yoonia vestfoldensis TaxID=245188 RepID=UPI00036E4C2F|nr:hypothetical protein [Yoonia vestfoldensis]